MTAVVRQLDSATIDKIINSAMWLPRGNATDDSRIADKFGVRAYQELFSEMDRLAVLQLRSMNSECVMAIIDSIDGRARSTAALEALTAHLDSLAPGIHTSLLQAVPTFSLSECKVEAKFMVRFPVDVRDSVVQCAEESREPMVSWVRKALEYWINNQRQQQALLATITSINTHSSRG